MRDVVAIAKALSDPGRLRALFVLKKGELCVCQIGALLELAPSTVSKHLSILKEAGLVEGCKRGRWVYYRRASRGATKVAGEALRWVDRSLSGAQEIKEDRKRLREIARMPLEELCRTYLKGAA